jgi:hypothetical protein
MAAKKAMKANGITSLPLDAIPNRPGPKSRTPRKIVQTLDEVVLQMYGFLVKIRRDGVTVTNQFPPT